jgi:hypothetical protein
MITVNELVDYLNSANIIQIEGMPYDLPEEIKSDPYWNELNDDPIATDIDPIEHRWYVTVIYVWKVRESYVGARVVETLKSESMGVEDCYHTIDFVEMKPVETVTYAIK